MNIARIREIVHERLAAREAADTLTERVAALGEAVRDEEITRATRILDWIGVAGGMPVSERVKWLAIELACKQGFSLDEAERIASEVAGPSLTMEAIARGERRAG